MLDSQVANEPAIATPSLSLSQPRALYLLFFTELWERFGFYTVQTIIILYMTKGLLFNDAQANLLYAAFSALLYLTPTIGGYIADRYLGFQRAINLGGLLFFIGYLVCTSTDKTIFFLGLSILIIANGFFKANVSSIVGELYKENDPRRDGGFTLFYMGINIGALIPPLIAGALVAKYGWHSGFLVAAFGMAFGQLIFLWGKRKLGNAGLEAKGRIGKKPLSYAFYALLLIGIVASVGLCQLAFQYPTVTNYVIEISAVLVLCLVFFYLFKESPAQRKKMLAALILILISVAFWSLYNQAFTSLTLFADRNMENHFLGFPFDAEASQFFNPFFIITLSPLLSRFWLRMDQRALSPTVQTKFFLGMAFTCAGFLILALAAQFFAHAGIISAWWVGLSYFFQTIGELLISPIGLAMITVLCPKHLVGMMMGVWFFSQAASFAIGGYLANLAAVPANLPAQASLPIYSHAFMIYGAIALAATIATLFLLPLINKMLQKA